MPTTSFLDATELAALGLKSLGKDVLISRKASIYNPAKVVIGNNTRIDDYCILSAGVGGINIGSRVHVACYSCLIGAAAIVMHDFSCISSRVAVYSSADDFSGQAMSNPTVPDKFRKVMSRPVTIGRHVLVGTGSTILPGVTLAEGVSVGAMSFVDKDCDAFGIYAGIPARRLKERKRDLLELERRLLSESAEGGNSGG